MEQQTSPPKNLLIQLAKQKAEAQKAGGNSKFGKFDARKGRFVEKPLLTPARGGRNGQGKP